VMQGAALGESQQTWDEDYDAPVSIQVVGVRGWVCVRELINMCTHTCIHT